MVSLPLLETKLGVKSILVEDESKRFGLNVYKTLGSSYALGCILAKHLNIDIVDIDLATVDSKLDKPLVFATATVGNHGIGVAWAAQKIEQKAVIFQKVPC
ncbi:hypothetical protein [Psychrobacter sp. SC65A.3]|uniref:hypothetical protein n=1 Tax=Psychrobacter sp. SC65A.3 TaxID=2983299 RepID=UPI0021DB67DD|nr:hypothetical protein [Psychrobacter sp. SC65A.3]